MVAFFITLVLLVPSLAAAQQSFVISTPRLNVDNCTIMEGENILTEAYSRIGQTVEFRCLPQLRDLEEVNTGKIDATMFRFPFVVKKYANLVQVPVPLLKLSYVAMSLKPGIRVNSWGDLNQYKVGILRGSISSVALAEQKGIEVHLVNHHNSAFKMLEEGRLDVLVVDHTLGMLSAQALVKEKVHTSKPLYEHYSYHYVNKKHEALVPALSVAFKEMLRDGTFKRLLGKYQAMFPELPSNSK